MSCDCHTLQEEREDDLMKEKRKLSKEVQLTSMNIHAVETPLSGHHWGRITCPN
jgi:hypothetical protein